MRKKRIILLPVIIVECKMKARIRRSKESVV